MIILPRSRWNEQPQVSSEIDWSHPSAKGLVRSVFPPFPQDLITGNSVTFAPLLPSWNGTVNASSSTTVYPISYASGSEHVVPSATSVTFLISIAKVDNGGALFSSGATAGGPALFFIKSDGRPLVRTQAFGANILNPTTGPAVDFNAPANLAISFPYSAGTTDPRTLAVYWNGFLRHSGTITRSDENWVNASFFRIGSRSGEVAAGPVSGFWLWNRELTPSELVSLTNNPWQLLKQNRFIFPAQAAANAYSLDTTPGTYNITGSAATTLATRLVDTTPGAYNLTGSSASLNITNPVLSVSPGAYNITGAAVSLLKSGELTAGGGPGKTAKRRGWANERAKFEQSLRTEEVPGQIRAAQRVLKKAQSESAQRLGELVAEYEAARASLDELREQVARIERESRIREEVEVASKVVEIFAREEEEIIAILEIIDEMDSRALLAAVGIAA